MSRKTTEHQLAHDGITPEMRCAGREHAQRVADLIEGTLPRGPLEKLGFNMASWETQSFSDRSGRECGTTACIAGWSQNINHGPWPTSDPEGHREAVEQARKDFGLTRIEAHRLFQDYPGVHVTDKQAVKVLRHYGNTGEVDWAKS